jgi:hypothetical protein
MPTFNAPRKVEIILYDDDGSKRVAIAERAHGRSNLPHWDLALQHQPSGRSWPADFNGSNIVDALTELIERKDHEYHASRGRAPHPMLADRNVPVNDAGDLTRALIMPRR